MQKNASKSGNQAYSILLILTDGAVTDVQKTAVALKAVCEFPLSVLIVGIGDANFNDMKFLDDDIGAKHDICDFVQFNLHKHDADSLTKDTLEEIPRHLTDYFLRNGIFPPPIKIRDNEIVAQPEEPEIDLSLSVEHGTIQLNRCGYVPPKSY